MHTRHYGVEYSHNTASQPRVVGVVMDVLNINEAWPVKNHFDIANREQVFCVEV